MKKIINLLIISLLTFICIIPSNINSKEKTKDLNNEVATIINKENKNGIIIAITGSVIIITILTLYKKKKIKF